jgi:hypothetical protein
VTGDSYSMRAASSDVSVGTIQADRNVFVANVIHVYYPDHAGDPASEVPPLSGDSLQENSDEGDKHRRPPGLGSGLYDNLGTQTQDYGHLAEAIFNLNIDRWVGNPVEVITLQQDYGQVDLHVKLPTFLKGKLDLVSDSMVLNWQIRHTANPPCYTQLVINECSVPAIRVEVDDKTVQRLRHRARADRNPLLLAYGVVKQTDRASLVDEDIYEAFDWYAIDLAQYFNQVPNNCNAICIPIDNRLNLLSFSLLWASHWVREFYRPLTRASVREHEELDSFVKGIYKKGFSSLGEVAAIRDELERKLPQLLQSLQANEVGKYQISTALALGVTLEDIRAHVRSASPVRYISTYCPESLYGTASLWLFSRSYWKFMAESACAVELKDRLMNRRWLPVRCDLRQTPRLLWGILYCVVKLYERLGVNVAVVCPFSDDGLGADRSVYGGNIGHLPYISLSNDGLQWTREIISRGDESSHRDFFAQAPHHVIIGHGEPLTNIPALRDLPSSQLKLSGAAPRLLFAEESFFVKYPTPLWSGILT